MTPDAEARKAGEGEHDPNPVVEIKDAHFSWDMKGDAPALKNISLKMEKGNNLTMVAGLVGSGKSALAQAILGTVTKTGGEISVKGSIAYVPQTVPLVSDLALNRTPLNCFVGMDHEYNSPQQHHIRHAVR